MARVHSSLFLFPLLALGLATALPAQGNADQQEPTTRQVKALAQELDRLVEADLRAHQQKPNPRADDGTFARRVYLDLVGRIPTVAEMEAFVDARKSSARSALVDDLLIAPGHRSHMFNWLADLLRAKTRLQGQTSGEPYLHWLREAIAANLPWDQLVTELITADGAAHARGNGATGYYLRDREMPEDNMANTARVFLGTRLECAQCHNHPFDTWTQKQFFQMVAFTGGIKFRHDEDPDKQRELRAFDRELRQQDPQARRAFRLMMRPVAAGIAGSGTGVVRLPEDYPYEDAGPGSWVTAKALFGEDPQLAVALPTEQDRRGKQEGKRRRGRKKEAPEIDSRTAYATWLTSPDNPRFARAIANRMWQRLFGRGVIEPVDNLTDATVPANPVLMDRLERLMVELDFDLVQFQRVLCHTEAYQRAASNEPGLEEVYRFPGPVLRRMSAEQMWDSMLTLVVDDVDAELPLASERAERIYDEYDRMIALGENEMLARIEREKVRFDDPDMYREMRRDERRQEAAERRADNEEDFGVVRETRRELRKARRARDWDRVAELEQQMEGRIGQVQQRRGLRRASQLASPAPAGHLLRQFGQSDREQIEAAHTDANVPQVLTLLNGFVDQQIMRPESLLRRTLEQVESDEERVRTAYLAILGREPGRAERSAWMRDVARAHSDKKDDETAEDVFRDLIWVLLNTNEFRFVQ